MRVVSLEDKVRERIERSPENVFLSSDFADFANSAQISRLLRRLSEEGVLIKIGVGIFVKTIKSPYFDKPIPKMSFPELAREALQKLNVKTFPCDALLAYNNGLSTQVPTGLMIGVNKRVSRKLAYNGRSIKYERVFG